MKLYLSSPWYNPSNVKIRNLAFKSFGKYRPKFLLLFFYKDLTIKSRKLLLFRREKAWEKNRSAPR